MPLTNYTQKFLFLIPALLGLACSLNAQSRYQKIDQFVEGQAIIVTSDGGVVVAGRSGNPLISPEDDPFLSRFDVNGQKIWANTAYGGDTQRDDAISVIQTADGGFVACGSTNSFTPFQDAQAYMFKSDPDGIPIWTRHFGGPEGDRAVVVKEDNTDLLLGGCLDCFNTGMPAQAYLVKTDDEGNQILARTYTDAGATEIFDIAVLNDGYLLGCGTNSAAIDFIEDAVLIRTNKDGDVLWANAYAQPDTLLNIIRVRPLASGGFLVCGSALLNGSDKPSAYLMWVDSDGTRQDIRFYGGADDDLFFDAKILQGDSILAGGMSFSQSNGAGDFYLVKADPGGNLVWERNYGNILQENIRSFDVDADGFIWAAGTSRRLINAQQSDSMQAFVLKISPDGLLNDHILWGNIYEDLNSDCLYQDNESGRSDWIIEISSSTDTIYQNTDIDGSYFIPLASNTPYSVRVFPNAPIWQACQATYSILTGNSLDSTRLDAGFASLYDCSYLRLQSGHAGWKACDTSEAVLSLSQQGTVNLDTARIALQLDDQLTLVDANVDFELLPNNEAELLVLSLDGGETARISLQIAADCAMEPASTHCFRAQAEPALPCFASPSWNGSFVEVEAECQGSTMTLTALNPSNQNTNQDLGIVIEEDFIATLTEPLNLNAGQDSVYVFPADGRTRRIKFQQVSDYPFESRPSIALEACLDPPGSGSSKGFVTADEEDEKEYWKIVDCQQSQTTIISLDKRAYPEGRTVEHFIDTTALLDYLIVFPIPDSGSSRILINESLSPFLDPTSIQAGSSSHEYEMILSQNAQVSFILEAASTDGRNGFIHYRIQQKPNNPEGTVIRNETEIFLGYNQAITTDTLFHTIYYPPLYGSRSIGICESESYNGLPILQDTLVYDSIANMFGDSIYLTHVKLLYHSDSLLELALCQGEQLVLGSDTLFQSGQYLFDEVAVNGCDSLLDVRLDVISRLDSNLTVDLCRGDSLFIQDWIITAPGSFQDTISGASGCDSIVFDIQSAWTILLSEIDTFHLVDDPFWGLFLNQDTTIELTFISSEGCDSLVRYNIDLITNVLSKDGEIRITNAFPNPFSDRLNVDMVGSVPIKPGFKIYDLMGHSVQAIFFYDPTKQRLIIQTSELPPGAYLLEISAGPKKSYSQLIIKNE